MTRTLLARPELVDDALDARRPALLLEGVWPDGSPPWRDSLDDRIDARFEWIDLQASHWADRVGRQQASTDATEGPTAGVTPAYLNALALRYYLVKLIRVVAYLTEVRPVQPGERLELVASRGRDEDYADLLTELAASTGAELHIRWKDAPRPTPVFPPNGRLRRWIGEAAQRIEPPVGDPAVGHRVVLCGNPKILDPVCEELLGRGCRVWWLYDRFAIRAWMKWRARGVGQLTCQSSLGRRNLLSGALPERLLCRGVDLTPALGRWLAERMRTHGRGQTRMIERVDAHFSRIRPDCLVACEDATPLARAAVCVARRYQATSFVVQHGAPMCRFGFAPLAADRFLAWGAASRRQLTAWGVSEERVLVTGSPRHDPAFERLRADMERVVSARLPSPSGRGAGSEGALRSEEGSRASLLIGLAGYDDLPSPPGKCVLTYQATSPSPSPDGRRKGAKKILLINTVPPRDERPDAAAMHFNRRTYAQMLRMTLSAIRRLPGAELTIKPHPRAGRDPLLAAALRGEPSLPVRVVRRGKIERLAANADCVVSFISSAGIEATLSGTPVIQVLPPGSDNLAPHAWWGFVGTARSEDEMRRLLDRVVAGQWQPPSLTDGRVFDNFERSAAARVADAVLSIDRHATPAPVREPAMANSLD